jgi:hypothetical protein
MHLTRFLAILQIPHQDRVVGVPVVEYSPLVILFETKCECVAWEVLSSYRLFEFDSIDLRVGMAEI